METSLSRGIPAGRLSLPPCDVGHWARMGDSLGLTTGRGEVYSNQVVLLWIGQRMKQARVAGRAPVKW